jgi:MFS family permease
MGATKLEAQAAANKPAKLDPVGRRNFALLMVGAAVFNFGWAMPGVTRAPFINWLGMSNKMYGLIGSSWSLCMIGSFLFPWLSRRYPRKKWYQFVLTMPYLAADLTLGLAIVIAMATHSYDWLKPLTIGVLLFWPFAAGWTNGPQSEYIANCIPQSHIGRFVSMQQFSVGVVGLAGSAAITVLMTMVGVPARYALAFLLAYGLALVASIIPLFAHETPSPSPPLEPFWKPAARAVRHDGRFRNFLGAAMLLWMAVLVPQQFIPLLAIREWGTPDWVASSAATVQCGAMLLGAALAGLLGQKSTYGKALIICMLALPVAMAIGACPVSKDFRGDTFETTFGVTEKGVLVADAASHAAGAFRVEQARGEGNDLVIGFNKPVNQSSFTVNDVVITDAGGRRVEPLAVTPAGKAGDEWIIKLGRSRQNAARYRLRIQPYISDRAGAMLDQNGDGRSPWDAYRVLVIAAFFGLAFSGLTVGLETLMYQLSPAEMRSGYFSAYRVTQFFAPALAFPLGGALFKTGQFAGVFLALLVASALTIILSGCLLKPVLRSEERGTV